MPHRNRHDINESRIGPGVHTAAVSHPLNLLGVLDGLEYPTSKMELISYAQDNGASEEVLDQLQAIPDDIYNNLTELNQHINEIEIIEDGGDVFASEEARELPDETERYVSDLNGKGRI